MPEHTKQRRIPATGVGVVEHRCRRCAPAFTIIELLFAIGIIFLIMAMILGGLRFATRAGKTTADTTTVQSLKTAVEQFKQDFGFWPAMVKDQPTTGAPAAPLTGTPPRPNVYSIGVPADLAFLRQPPAAPTDPDRRFSIYSLGYYVVGVLHKDADGQDGPGFTTPTPDGAFSKRGRTFDPFFDTSRNAQAVFEDTRNPPNPGKIELRDAANTAFRYYRWMPDQGNRDPSDPLNDYLNVPRMVGDPTERQDVRSAEWAIVAAGRDGLFGDEHLLGTNHPQYVSQNDVASRLGIDPSLGTFDAEALRRAAKDNIVAIGGSRR